MSYPSGQAVQYLCKKSKYGLNQGLVGNEEQMNPWWIIWYGLGWLILIALFLFLFLVLLKLSLTAFKSKEDLDDRPIERYAPGESDPRNQ